MFPFSAPQLWVPCSLLPSFGYPVLCSPVARNLTIWLGWWNWLARGICKCLETQAEEHKEHCKQAQEGGMLTETLEMNLVSYGTGVLPEF